jgi:hypothetical protein
MIMELFIGIAHYNLKTYNVIVQRISVLQLQCYLQVKIVDFAIAKVKLQDKSDTITHSMYMA